jgi:type II secretory pathway component HofQ
MRVYLPATTTTLRELIDTGELGPAPLTGFAVTPQLRLWYRDSDEDELEYAALLEAARGSLRLLDQEPGAVPRRAIVAADVPDEEVTARPDLDRAVVRVSAPVPLKSVAAVHIDGSDAEKAVAAAVAVVLEADLGSDDAKFVVDGAEGYELLWYASQEVGPLLDLL